MKINQNVLIVLISALIISGLFFGIYLNENQYNESKSSGTAEYLYNLKISYIGNNSDVGNLLATLDIGLYGQYTFELKTSKKPYAIIIKYNVIEGLGNILDNPQTVIEKSAILLALIDNADEIHWILPNSKKIIKSNDLSDVYGNIKDYGKTVEDFKKLLIKLNYFEENDPITMQIKNLTNKGLTLVIKNHTNNIYLYGKPFSLERKKNGKWVAVKQTKNGCAFIMIGIILKDFEERDEKVDWGYCYGKLPEGEYRINKSFTQKLSDKYRNLEKKYTISAEFTL